MAFSPAEHKKAQGDQARPTLLWLRRDLRLADHPALASALYAGRPVIPVYIWDEVDAALLGAAPRWRLARSLEALAADIKALGGRLILRKGAAEPTLRALIEETGAVAVHWSRYYEASAINRDKAVKSALKSGGVEARSFEGFLLREPFETTTKTGGFFKVYTPFQKAFSADYTPADALQRPSTWPAPSQWPESLDLSDLPLEAAMDRGAAVLARTVRAGETAALERLSRFVGGPEVGDDLSGLAAYHDRRDRLDLSGTSGLSQHLTLGEISPRRAWLAASAAVEREPKAEAGAAVFLKELIWREFAWHLAFHTPEIRSGNWRPEWDAFEWSDDPDAGGAPSPELSAWRQGRTGVAVVDAAMREIYVTGVMHNRARMIVGSYLTKNLLVHWRAGERWFADCLVDFDPASNAMGWQWVAGSGPDAAPFFRIFNPDTQAERFDPQGRYRARWLPERGEAGRSEALALDAAPEVDGAAFFEACPRSWGLSPADPAPLPSLDLKAGRERALAAYQTLRRA
ncbi:MAG: deoxyribodipyrimidine photo-lyase [Pseudomonadota bacterium]